MSDASALDVILRGLTEEDALTGVHLAYRFAREKPDAIGFRSGTIYTTGGRVFMVYRTKSAIIVRKST